MIMGVTKALKSSLSTRCSLCLLTGASHCCTYKDCKLNFHIRCLFLRAKLDPKNPTIMQFFADKEFCFEHLHELSKEGISQDDQKLLLGSNLVKLENEVKVEAKEAEEKNEEEDEEDQFNSILKLENRKLKELEVICG